MQRPTTAKPFSFDFKLLHAACTALLSAQVPALVATLPLGLHAPTAIAQTQNAEAVAKVAQAITVRIEGATQGSGVLVKKEGNRYTVLTAWHVVSGQRPGEELGIYTPDGRQYTTEQGSIQRLGEVDLAVLTFSSSNSYEIARIGDIKRVGSGSSIFVSGFPLPTSAVPTRILRFLRGEVIANATVSIPNGYQLLYSNPTLPGMSGGAVLDSKGKLVGIHARAEKNDIISENLGKPVATGINQAVPISHMPFKKKADLDESSEKRTNTPSEIQKKEEENSFKGRTIEHIIMPGETLSEVAQKYNTSVSTIIKINNLESTQKLWMGSRIMVPYR